MKRRSIILAAALLSFFNFQLSTFNPLQAQSGTLQHNGEVLLMDNFESGGLTHFPWVNDAVNSWTVVSTTELQGQYAARSAEPTYSGTPSTSTLTLSVDFDAASTLSFRWYAPGAGYYYGSGTFAIDGTETAQYTANEYSVVEVSVPLTAGSHTLTWTYNCNNPESSDVSFHEYNYLYLDSVVFYFSLSAVVDLSGVTTDTIIRDGQTVTGTLSANVKISIEDGATVTLDNVTINGIDESGVPPWQSSDYPWAGLTCLGDATLVLSGENTVNSFHNLHPGILVAKQLGEGAEYTLTITGSGSLTATGNQYAAGIGSETGTSCGNITITGGTITATGGSDAAGIGSGDGAPCGNITITGGTVTATGDSWGAGIGSGMDGSCGNISITGGVVYATGGNYAAGIGLGNAISCGDITITAGVTGVTAIKGDDAANSIGLGNIGSCGTVTIGGTVYWDGSAYQNDGDNAETGIVKSPYRYPGYTYTLSDIPSGWTLTVDGQAITVTNGIAVIPADADVVLTPTDSDIPRVQEIELIDPLTIPLTFEAKVAGATVTFTKTTTLPSLSVEYSTDGTTWTTYTDPITLAEIGDKVSFRGDNAAYAIGNESGSYSNFSCSNDTYLYGNVMSLIDKDNYATSTELTEQSTFVGLFKDNTNICNHPSKPLLLPATTLTQYCYRHMFEGCTSLTTAPELPATTLAASCYSFMFKGCTGLTTAPQLPATTLTQFCYRNMFEGCTSLTTAPELPATTLADYCYPYMFNGCTSLTTAPELPATTLTMSCYTVMFQGCTQLATAPALPATTLDENCYNGMFRDCTSLTTAPELPATTLFHSCYKYMFCGCTALTTAPLLPAPTLVNNCYFEMFKNCSSLNKVTCFATNPINSYTSNWLSGVAATGTFIKPASMNDWTRNSASGIPTGWTTSDYENHTSLTFEAKVAGATVTFNIGANVTLSNPVEYSLNGGAWTGYTSGTTITLTDSADRVSFRGDNAAYATEVFSGQYSAFSCSNDCYLYGNVMSLISSTNYANPASWTMNAYAFCRLFQDNTHIVNHPSKTLTLPATTLAEGCYNGMFRGCSSLTTAPALPATTLAEDCYNGMFYGCTSLTTAPALPATTLAEHCYNDMFSGCTSLTTAPALPATTLASNCYRNMFYNCTSLTTAPALPATTLVNSCYRSMFEFCFNLTTVTCLATSGINTNNSTKNWLTGVAPTGTFIKSASTPTGSGTDGEYWPTDNPSGIPTGWTTSDYENHIPLTFEAKVAGATVTFNIGANVTLSNPVEYSLNGGAWTGYTSGTTITLTDSADRVSFRGDNAAYATGTGSGNQSTFSCSNDTYLYGNVMSLIDKDNYVANKTLAGFYTFYKLFYDNNKIYSHPSKPILLPATTLAKHCYRSMFQGCEFLTTPPALPATTLITSCYSSMFANCTHLTTPPELPATTLAGACYFDMFSGCTSLSTAPELPATTLAVSCYTQMFSGCTSLTTAPELPATTLISNCYSQMFFGCTSLTTAPVLPATTLAQWCYDYMFSGCSSLNSITCMATNITAINCTSNWLSGVAATGTFIKPASMNGWTRNSADGIPTGWTTSDYENHTPLTFEAKVAGATVTFNIGANVTLSNPVEYSLNGGAWTEYTSGTAITLADSADRVSFRGDNAAYATAIALGRYSTFSCSNDTYLYGNVMSLIDKDNYATSTELTGQYTFASLFKDNTNICNHPSKPLLLPATTLTQYCYRYMFEGCTSLTMAPKLPATTLAASCYSYMFYGCTSLTTAPELPATILTQYCYRNMFEGCTSLTTAPELPATTLAPYCYLYMFNGCTSLTTAPALPAGTLEVSCYRSMFNGCTSLTTAPALPAVTLVSSCYRSMFNGCTNLTSVTCLATSGINTNNSTENWLTGVAATGTLIKSASTPTGSGTNGEYWPTGSASGIPTGWTAVLP